MVGKDEDVHHKKQNHKYAERKIKKDGKEETLTKMYTKLGTLEMDLTKVKPLYEEMGVMNNPVRIIPSLSSGRRNVGLSFGSSDYAISETIDVGDMMMGLKRRESITIANNRLLSSLEAIASLNSSPQALCPSTKHHVTMMTKYSNPSPKSMMGSPLGKSRSSRRIFMGASLLSSEPKKSSRRVLMGSTPIYSAPSNNLFDPDLVASYEEALEDISWDKNHKENEQQMQEVEKELSEVLCIYAPTSATTTGVDRNIYDPFLCFERNALLVVEIGSCYIQLQSEVFVKHSRIATMREAFFTDLISLSMSVMCRCILVSSMS